MSTGEGVDSTASDILTEMSGLLALLQQARPSMWRRPTRCEGWTVADLARHVAGSPGILNEGVRRLLDGVETPATPGPLAAHDRAALLAELEAGRDETAALLATLRDQDLDRPCPFPFGTVPLAFGLQVMTFEYGGHHNDLAWALGDEKPLPLPVARAAASIVPILGDEVPEAPLAYVLAGETLRLSFVARDGAWQQEEPGDVPTCTVSGSDSAVMLFATGRLDVASDELRLHGATAAAAAFKSYFPGP